MKHAFVLLVGSAILTGCTSEQPPAKQSRDSSVPEPALAAVESWAQNQPPEMPSGRRRGKGMGPVRDAHVRPGILPPDSAEEFSFDAGRVIAGEVITHTFQIKNSAPHAVVVKQDTDIQLDCGCASIEPSSRILRAEAQTEVTLTIRTGGLKNKKGPFANGGQIVWTAASGHRHGTAVLIRGDALPPITSDPPMLAFTPDEIKRGVTKDLVFTANVPIDESTWSVVSSLGGFQLVDQVKPGAGQKPRCKVRCTPPEGIEDFRGEIRVEARARLSESKEIPVSISVPMQARQAVDLGITPRVAPLTFGPKGEPAKVKLVFRGERVTKDELQIRGISYPGSDVTWKLSRSPETTTAILEVTVLRKQKPKVDASRPRDYQPALRIELANGKTVSVPVVEVGPTLDAP
jgi:hypothetical protein